MSLPVIASIEVATAGVTTPRALLTLIVLVLEGVYFSKPMRPSRYT